MSYARISQKEARRLKRRVDELEQERARLFTQWTAAYPTGGHHLYNEQLKTDGWVFGRLQTARRLGCALIGTIDNNGLLNVYAVPKPA